MRRVRVPERLGGEGLVHTAALLHAGSVLDRRANQWVPADRLYVEVDERRRDGRLQRVEIERCPRDGARRSEDFRRRHPRRRARRPAGGSRVATGRSRTRSATARSSRSVKGTPPDTPCTSYGFRRRTGARGWRAGCRPHRAAPGCASQSKAPEPRQSSKAAAVVSSRPTTSCSGSLAAASMAIRKGSGAASFVRPRAASSAARWASRSSLARSRRAVQSMQSGERQMCLRLRASGGEHGHTAITCCLLGLGEQSRLVDAGLAMEIVQ